MARRRAHGRRRRGRGGMSSLRGAPERDRITIRVNARCVVRHSDGKGCFGSNSILLAGAAPPTADTQPSARRLQLRSSDSGQSQCPQVIWYTLTPKRHDRGQCPLGVKRTDLGPKTVASRHCPPPRSTLTPGRTRDPPGWPQWPHVYCTRLVHAASIHVNAPPRSITVASRHRA